MRKNRKNRFCPDSGFTLIEVLMAMGILSVALFGIAAGSGWLLGRNTLSGQILTAAGMARDRIEELQSLPAGLISMAPSTESHTGVDGVVYRIETDFRDLPNRMEIDVTVFWTAGGKIRKVGMNHIRGRPEG